MGVVDRWSDRDYCLGLGCGGRYRCVMRLEGHFSAVVQLEALAKAGVGCGLWAVGVGVDVDSSSDVTVHQVSKVEQLEAYA
jgi:hypothetical protein